MITADQHLQPCMGILCWPLRGTSGKCINLQSILGKANVFGTENALDPTYGVPAIHKQLDIHTQEFISVVWTAGSK